MGEEFVDIVRGERGRAPYLYRSAEMGVDRNWDHVQAIRCGPESHGGLNRCTHLAIGDRVELSSIF
jgi:hypothetical protein